MTEGVLKKKKGNHQNKDDSDWIVRKWHVQARNSLCRSCKDEDEFGTVSSDGCATLYWTVWDRPQTAEHDPSISAKVWSLWGSPNPSQAPFQHQCIPGFRPTWQFSSKQVPSTEAAWEVPVALTAQEIFQVYLIFEHRENLPGKKCTLHLQLLPLQANGNFCSCKYLQGALTQENLCFCAVLNPSPQPVEVKALRH